MAVFFCFEKISKKRGFLGKSLYINSSGFRNLFDLPYDLLKDEMITG